MDQGTQPKHSNINVAFIKSAWHQDIVDQGHLGFVEELNGLTDEDNSVHVFDVPGAFEIPLLAKDLANTKKYSAIVCCGLVVDGDIYRHDYVAETVISGLMQVQLETGVPVLSVVLTPKEFSESEEHQKFFFEHFKVKGQEAANACISILKTRQSLNNA